MFKYNPRNWMRQTFEKISIFKSFFRSSNKITITTNVENNLLSKESAILLLSIWSIARRPKWSPASGIRHRCGHLKTISFSINAKIGVKFSKAIIERQFIAVFLNLNRLFFANEIPISLNWQTCPENCADRVNLGLIPSSEESWPTACRALRKETGGFLHIHANVDIMKSSAKAQKGEQKQEWIEWAEKSRSRIKQLLDERTRDNEGLEWRVENRHIEYVKSYGPRVDHLVLDLECRPEKNKSSWKKILN